MMRQPPDRQVRQEILVAAPASAVPEQAPARVASGPPRPTRVPPEGVELWRVEPVRVDAAELVRVALEREGSLRVAL